MRESDRHPSCKSAAGDRYADRVIARFVAGVTAAWILANPGDPLNTASAQEPEDRLAVVEVKTPPTSTAVSEEADKNRSAEPTRLDTTNGLIIESGKNLFGEDVGEGAVLTQSVTVPLIERVFALIDRNTKMHDKRVRVKDTLRDLNIQLEQNQTRLIVVRNLSENVQRQIMMTWEPPFSFYKKERGIVMDAEGVRRERRTLERKALSLRGEAATLEQDRAVLQNLYRETAAGYPDPGSFTGFFSAASKLAGPAEWVSIADAKRIVGRCESELAQNPNRLEMRWLLACGHFHAGRYDTAKEEFGSVMSGSVSNRPTEPLEIAIHQHAFAHAIIGRAWTAMKAGDLDAARKDFADKRLQPVRQTVDYDSLLGEAMVRKLEGRYRESLKLLQRAWKKTPTRPDAYRVAAVLALESQNPAIDDAVEWASRACQCDERDDWRNRLALARAFRASGDDIAADENLRRARELAPDEQALEEIAASIALGP